MLNLSDVRTLNLRTWPESNRQYKYNKNIITLNFSNLMKKILILSALAVTAFAASAQETVVKEAEKAMKSGKPYSEVEAMIAPAKQDAVTGKQAQTYYIPGKTAFKQYDDMLGKRQFGMYKEDDPKTPEIFHTMAKDLLGGYDNYMKALSLDTVVDEKGKVKTKYSKEILSTLQGHYNDFNVTAVDFWNAKDYGNAYRCWQIFLDFPSKPGLSKNQKVPADSVLAEIMYNQALAAWQNNDLPSALAAFRNADKHGYSKEQLFTYGAAVANDSKDLESLKYFASRGSELFPQNDNFASLLINYYLGSKKYDEALEYLNDAVAKNPGNAQYVTLQGIIYDNQGKLDEAMKAYEKALQLNPENPIANLYYGLGLNAKAGTLADSYTGSNFDAYKKSTINPMLQDAVKYLRKAYELDKNIRSECLKVLDLVYYNLEDAEGQEWVKNARLED